MAKSNWKIVIDGEEAHIVCLRCVDPQFASGYLAPINSADDGGLIVETFRLSFFYSDINRVTQKHDLMEHHKI